MLNTILWIVALIFAILVLYDVWAINKKDSNGIKILWTILAILFSIITGIVYYIIRKI